ncbi:MAG: hypothetical protein ACTSWR_11560, partial [Candidatus Helarchaeota archaeon]
KYPVPDCEHARVAMAYAKKNKEPAYVIACIKRKAKALGCPFKDSKDEVNTENVSSMEILRSAEYVKLVDRLKKAYIEIIALLRYMLKKDEFSKDYATGYSYVVGKYGERTLDSLADTIVDLKEDLNKYDIDIITDGEDSSVKDEKDEKDDKKDDKNNAYIDSKNEKNRKSIGNDIKYKGLALIKKLLEVKSE